MRKVEFQNQAALVQWANARAPLDPRLRLLYHVPNGGSRDVREAANLKRAGVKRGVPDLHLPVRNSVYIGLWIEMKSPEGRVDREQRAWHDALRDEGHRVEVCHDWIAARDLILDYLSS